ncbi:TPA: hypothetical protein ACPYPT_000198 [Legionella pneumophila]
MNQYKYVDWLPKAMFLAIGAFFYVPDHSFWLKPLAHFVIPYVLR